MRLLLGIALTYFTHAASANSEEFLFTDVWKNLGKIMKPLAHNPEVSDALERWRSISDVVFDASAPDYYKVDKATLIKAPPILRDLPITRPAMVKLALDILLSCESGLAGANTMKLAEDALAYLAFIKFQAPDGSTWRIWHKWAR